MAGEWIGIKGSIFKKFTELEPILLEKLKFMLILYDAKGRKLKEVKKSLAPEIHQSKIFDIKKGVYFIKIKTD